MSVFKKSISENDTQSLSDSDEVNPIKTQTLMTKIKKLSP